MQSILNHVTTTQDEGYNNNDTKLKNTELLDFPYTLSQIDKEKYSNVRGTLEHLPLENEYSRHNETAKQLQYESTSESKTFVESSSPMLKFSSHDSKESAQHHNNYNNNSPKHIQEQTNQESNPVKRVNVGYMPAVSSQQQNNRRFPAENGIPNRDVHNPINSRREIDQQMKEHTRRSEHHMAREEKENSRFEQRKEAEMHYFHHSHHDVQCSMQECCRKESSTMYAMNEMHSSKPPNSSVSNFFITSVINNNTDFLLKLCMYVCMDAWMHVCMYVMRCDVGVCDVCECNAMDVCNCDGCMHACMCVWVVGGVCMHVCVHACMCVFV